jgi:predicted dehydrogenase
MGCAGIATRRMLPAMAASPDVEIAAIASRSAETAAEHARRFGGRPVHGYDALLRLGDIDAVYIPLPTGLHARWTEAALLAGKHVLAEKPLATDEGTVRQLTALAERSGLALAENVMFVRHGQHAVVRDLVAAGAIGEPRTFHAAFTVPRRQEDDIRHRADLGGGALWDTGVYPVRAALELLGKGLTVAAAVLSAGPACEVETWGSALLQTPGGTTAQLTFGLDNAYRSEYSIWGSEATITLTSAFTPTADHRPALRIQRQAGTEIITLDAEDQVAAAVAAFTAAARDRTPPGDAPALQARLLDEIRMAAALVESQRLSRETHDRE